MEQLINEYNSRRTEYEHILNFEVFGITIERIIWATVVFFGLYIIFRVFRYSIISRLKAWAARTSTGFDDEVVLVLENIRPLFYKLVALYFALKILDLHSGIYETIDRLFLGLIIFQAVLSLQTFIIYLLKKIIVLNQPNSKQAQNETTFHAVKIIAQVIIWITAFLLLLSNLGINITSLAASLGIGGIAVALAVQNILGDILSSFSIYFDKPFEIGDFITIGTDVGTVEKIGIKTTRIRTLQGEELVVSNKELTSTRINNFKKMEKRRVVYALGVTYDTTLEQLKAIPKIIEDIYQTTDNADLDRVHFKDYGNFSLNFEIVYYHLSGDYAEYMDVRQEINLKIKEEFDKANIDMAFPTQTLHVTQTT